MFAGQAGLQVFLLIICFISVPCMLLPKPLILKKRHEKRSQAVSTWRVGQQHRVLDQAGRHRVMRACRAAVGSVVVRLKDGCVTRLLPACRALPTACSVPMTTPSASSASPVSGRIADGGRGSAAGAGQSALQLWAAPIHAARQRNRRTASIAAVPLTCPHLRSFCADEESVSGGELGTAGHTRAPAHGANGGGGGGGDHGHGDGEFDFGEVMVHQVGTRQQGISGWSQRASLGADLCAEVRPPTFLRGFWHSSTCLPACLPALNPPVSLPPACLP